MKSGPTIKKWLKNIFSLARNLVTQRFFLTAVVFGLIYLLFAVMIAPARVTVELGKPSPRTVFATRDVLDEYSTNLRREEAASAVQDVFTHDSRILEDALRTMDEFFDVVSRLREDTEKDLSEKTGELQQYLGDDVPETVLVTLLQTGKATLDDLHGQLEVMLTRIIEEQGIKVEGVETAKKQAMQEIGISIFSLELKKVAEKLIEPLVRPNMIFNPTATAEKKEAARQEVEPTVIHRGTRIISEGETVTREHLARLETLGLVRGGHADYLRYTGLFLLLVIFFFAVGIYLYVFQKDIYANTSMLVLLGLIVVITLIFAMAVNYFSAYLMPIAAAVILITILFDYRLAILLNAIFALMVGLITGGETSIIIMSLIGGLVAILTVSRLSRRTDLVKAGLYVSMVNAVIIIAVFLLLGNLRLEYGYMREFGYSLAAGIGNGIFSAVVAIGLLPFLESGFGLTTSVTLLELSNPNQPLLRQLLIKAPGTYHHSIVVGNLAESAAEKVNADPLLVRVGAYYHDIGKINRPYFFSENQIAGENPHQKLSPNLSALIISAHVKEGVELARSENLPEIIIDIIKQHHGTSMISYFYQQALENERAEVMEENFRYEGPRPQTKEAAIIMLADAVEAGVRSLSQPSSDRMEGMVHKIIREKLNDGQLDESDLTLKDIDKIADAFVYILTGIYHHRIEYPESELRAEIGRLPDESLSE
ncbi:MAG: HDIG domain-containing protein [Firmicutes bacterium]|jgi:putative nucleotidyltransferase with HDIG domain|nr:HDIG domain-containing protein [Bacillota bacterium]